MKTHLHAPTGNVRFPITAKLIAFMSAVVFMLTLEGIRADIPAPSSGEFRGMYKVTASTDPIFPIQGDKEWFLDFGKGISTGNFSGNVAVSLRQNPNVKVRIMAWQYFPKEGNIMIGNPYFEGSKNAVARGNWQMRPTSGGILFERENYQVVLQPADPRDY